VIDQDALDRIADLVLVGVRLDALEDAGSEDVAEVVSDTIGLTIRETATEIIAALIEAGRGRRPRTPPRLSGTYAISGAASSSYSSALMMCAGFTRTRSSSSSMSSTNPGFAAAAFRSLSDALTP
jgi:hypothetical protein